MSAPKFTKKKAALAVKKFLRTMELPPRAEFALRLAHACLLQWEQEAGREATLHELTRVAREACEEALS